MDAKNEQESPETPDADPAGEYVTIIGESLSFELTRREGARVAEQLARWWTPRWLEFTDWHGNLVRVRSAHIDRVQDSSPATRQRERDFWRAKNHERRSDERHWEDD